jgi:L-ribulose-5-phosphate 4-epimerase
MEPRHIVEGNEMQASEENPLKNELVEFAQRCGSEGWCPGTAGNISVYDIRLGKIHIKRSGADLKRLQLKDLLTFDVNGKLIDGEGRPSIETNFHLGIYRVRQDAGAVFHVHPPFATAYAVKGIKIPMVTEAAKIVLIEIPLLRRAMAGSVELAEEVAEGFKNKKVKAVLLRDHGIIAIGGKLQEAYHTASLVEDTAKVALLSSLL